ncbi:uncharacterized protein [Branchiostoma lanceolatum]|uniref:uncharacterized protein isoform X3 n=1 Tax=Branchiostoma lanceolatum TaxID=7740 RepID=UPI0034559775
MVGCCPTPSSQRTTADVWSRSASGNIQGATSRASLHAVRKWRERLKSCSGERCTSTTLRSTSRCRSTEGRSCGTRTTGGSHHSSQPGGNIYWYNNGLLFPDMGTVFIAMDRADKNNGCLQVMRGSHRAGRIDHSRVAGQTGADTDRVQHLEKVLEVVHAELEAGDAIFFHCNVLHRSDANRSDRIRWGYLIAYNRATNDPVFEHYNASYTPLHMVDDSEIKRCTNMTDFSGKCFTDPADNKNISGVRVKGH